MDVEYTGPATISKERILAQMRTKVGQVYSNEIVQEDIKALYKTGYIRNVRIFAQPEGDGVKVIVAVQTRAILREIEITGAQRIKPQRLRKEIKVKLNQAVDEQQLEEARQKIIETYQARGFTDVSVQFRIDPIDEKRGTARAVFTVNDRQSGSERHLLLWSQRVDAVVMRDAQNRDVAQRAASRHGHVRSRQRIRRL